MVTGPPNNIPLDFAIQGRLHHSSGLIYRNLLDQMLDSLIFPISKLRYSNIQLVISETGWPNSGKIEEPGVNICNAAKFILKISSKE